MKCVICDGTGSKTPGETCLQSTPHGSVCSECIAQLVADVIQMRKPWDKAEWKRLELEDYEESKRRTLMQMDICDFIELPDGEEE